MYITLLYFFTNGVTKHHLLDPIVFLQRFFSICNKIGPFAPSLYKYIPPRNKKMLGLCIFSKKIM